MTNYSRIRLLDPPPPQHPRLLLNTSEPVSHGGYPAEVFQYVLHADGPNLKTFPVKIAIVEPNRAASMKTASE